MARNRPALHLYSQIVGKYRLARTPWLNHSWHATLYPNARGCTTGLVPDLPGGIELSFDLLDPVHLFWGGFDLAVTRFSGRRAPLHPGDIPALPDDITCEAYSHEVSSAGFWPGGGAIDFPAFYSYAYPAPAGFAAAKVSPEGRISTTNLGSSCCPMTLSAAPPVPRPR